MLTRSLTLSYPQLEQYYIGQLYSYDPCCFRLQADVSVHLTDNILVWVVQNTEGTVLRCEPRKSTDESLVGLTRVWPTDHNDRTLLRAAKVRGYRMRVELGSGLEDISVEDVGTSRL